MADYSSTEMLIKPYLIQSSFIKSCEMKHYSARSAKKMYKNYCRIRCRDATDKAGRLADNIVQVCRFLNYDGFAKAASQDTKAVKAYAGLNGYVSATLDVAKDWVRFCLRLNEEHRYEFNESAISDEEIKHLQNLKECLHELDDMGKIEAEPSKSSITPVVA